MSIKEDDVKLALRIIGSVVTQVLHALESNDPEKLAELDSKVGTTSERSAADADIAQGREDLRRGG